MSKRKPKNELERKMKILRDIYFNECFLDILDKMYKKEYEPEIRKGASDITLLLAHEKMNRDVAILAITDALLLGLQEMIPEKDFKLIESILNPKKEKK
jgi:hypothetical protein